MEFILNVAITAIEQVILSLLHNRPYLAMSVVIAVLLKVYVNAERVATFLHRYRGASVVAATTAAVATPFCSCGTTAVILGMMASQMPWAPRIGHPGGRTVAAPAARSTGLGNW